MLGTGSPHGRRAPESPTELGRDPLLTPRRGPARRCLEQRSAAAWVVHTVLEMLPCCQARRCDQATNRHFPHMHGLHGAGPGLCRLAVRHQGWLCTKQTVKATKQSRQRAGFSAAGCRLGAPQPDARAGLLHAALVAAQQKCLLPAGLRGAALSAALASPTSHDTIGGGISIKSAS